MYISDLEECETFFAGDGTVLRELLHPDKADLALRYSLAHALLPKGESSIAHRLKTSEVYYILAGEGEMHIDDDLAGVHAGQAVYIPPGAVQWIRNTGTTDLTFLCIVDPAWRPEDEEVL
jgi:mannose-6-phosphate isomerase-like protein (cupin superfamily)